MQVKVILEAIEKDDPKVALGIRDLMFTFQDLMGVPEAGIRELLGQLDKKNLALALRGASEAEELYLQIDVVAGSGNVERRYGRHGSGALARCFQGTAGGRGDRPQAGSGRRRSVWERKAKMSTSFSPTIKPEPKIEALPFAYPQAAESGIAGSNSGSSAGTGDAPLSVHAAGERREETIREAGRQEGEANARGAWKNTCNRCRRVRVTLTDFASERRIYFERVESEVVKLALSIAPRSSIASPRVNPLLLEALVRVALDRVKSKTKVVVRVHRGKRGIAAPISRNTWGRAMSQRWWKILSLSLTIAFCKPSLVLPNSDSNSN